MKIFAKKKSHVDREIDAIYEQMHELSHESEEYLRALDVIQDLQRIKEVEKRFKVSPDTAAVILGNFALALLILNYEKAGVVTSKAFGFIVKGRV